MDASKFKVKLENGETAYQYKYPHPSVTADCLVFGYDGKQINLLLIQRLNEPHKGKWAFPGGFLETYTDNDSAASAKRELEEETGLIANEVYQLKAYSAIDRDPRERVITVAYYTFMPVQEVHGQDDAKQAKWFAIDELPPLAFDHETIVKDALNVLKEQIYFQPICFKILPELFTLKQLKDTYETLLGVQFDQRNFCNKIIKTGIIRQAEETTRVGKNRETHLYRFDKEQYDAMKREMKLEF